MKILKAFALALNMLSIIPFFKVHDFYKGINGYSVMFHPLVGFILGAILLGVHILLNPHIPCIHLSVIIFTLWILLTGALHLDGLSDTIDGFFVAKERSLKVMKDSHVGGMGMIFTFVFLVLKLSSIIYFEIYELLYLLPLIMLLSRLNASLAIYFYPYISSGVGSLLKEEFSIKHLVFSLFYSLVFAYYFDSLLLMLVSLLTLFSTAQFLKSRLNGLNGDMYGFIIEVSELIMLNYLIIIHFP